MNNAQKCTVCHEMAMHCAVRRLGLLNSEYYLLWMLIFSSKVMLRWVGVLCCPEVMCLLLLVLEVRLVKVRLEHISRTTDSQHYLYDIRAPVTSVSFPSLPCSVHCRDMTVPCTRTRTVHSVCTVSVLWHSNLEHAACHVIPRIEILVVNSTI